MVRRLAAEDSGMDVLGLDVTWTQEFASAKWIREWTGAGQEPRWSRAPWPGPLDTARYEDKLYAAPKNTNVQLLWYRSPTWSPEPPKTWDEMITAAQDLKGQGKPYQVLTMGAQYEGLVVLYNTLAESAGGKILSDDGKKAVMDAGTVKALDQLQRFATSGVTVAVVQQRHRGPGPAGRSSPATARSRSTGRSSTRRCRRRTRSWPRRSSGRRVPGIDAGHPEQGHHRRGQPGGQRLLQAPGRSRSRRRSASATPRTRSSPRSTTGCRRPSRRSTTTRRWPRRTR